MEKKLEGKRVVQLSFDVIIPEDFDGYAVAEHMASLINRSRDEEIEVIGHGFSADMTEFYLDSWL